MDSKRAVLQLFENLLKSVVAGTDIPYVDLVRTLDAWGVERGGILYQDAMEVAREINAESG